MPVDGLWEESGFGEEFLEVVFAEVEVGVWGRVQGEDVVGRFEFGDGDEADGFFGGGCCGGGVGDAG